MSDLGHSLQVRPRPLVHKCPPCTNTDRKFWALGFVAMGQQQTFSARHGLIGQYCNRYYFHHEVGMRERSNSDEL